MTSLTQCFTLHMKASSSSSVDAALLSVAGENGGKENGGKENGGKKIAGKYFFSCIKRQWLYRIYKALLNINSYEAQNKFSSRIKEIKYKKILQIK